MHQNGISSTFTVRRIGANGVGVEKIIPFHSPIITKIKLVKPGKVRRAKLYYIRRKSAKESRLKAKADKTAKEEPKPEEKQIKEKAAEEKIENKEKPKKEEKTEEK